MENLKLNLEEGSKSFWRSALHYQSAITMEFREVVDDRHVEALLNVNEVSLAFPYVKSAANLNERHCRLAVRCHHRPRKQVSAVSALFFTSSLI